MYFKFMYYYLCSSQIKDVKFVIKSVTKEVKYSFLSVIRLSVNKSLLRNLH